MYFPTCSIKSIETYEWLNNSSYHWYVVESCLFCCFSGMFLWLYGFVVQWHSHIICFASQAEKGLKKRPNVSHINEELDHLHCFWLSAVSSYWIKTIIDLMHKIVTYRRTYRKKGELKWKYMYFLKCNLAIIYKDFNQILLLVFKRESICFYWLTFKN